MVGGICQCTGPLGNNPGEFDPYKAWIDTVNASGGINGHPIRFVSFDDKSNPGLSVNDVHTLVQSDHVIAIVDATAEDQGWASYVQGAPTFRWWDRATRRHRSIRTRISIRRARPRTR